MEDELRFGVCELLFGERGTNKLGKTPVTIHYQALPCKLAFWYNAMSLITARCARYSAPTWASTDT